jgi:hypothetical protein
MQRLSGLRKKKDAKVPGSEVQGSKAEKKRTEVKGLRTG